MASPLNGRYPIVVSGYHATSGDVAEALLCGATEFRLSANAYDWLGDGIYFWQDAPSRAWESANEPRQRGRLGSDVAVLGARIRLERRLDLLDTNAEPLLAFAFRQLEQRYRQMGRELPAQSELRHPLDRLVIEEATETFDQAVGKVGAVRAAFQEGRPMFPGSALSNRSHVQIAVRARELIDELWLVRRS